MAPCVCLPLLVGRVKRLVALLGFFVLCALGAWQVKRLHWKESILQKIKTPSRVHTSLSAPLKAFDRVRIRGTFLTQALHVIGRTHEGKGGYHVFVPFRTLDGEQVLVNVGWRPQRDFKEAGGVKTLEGYVRYGEKNWAPPPHNPSKDEWGHGDPKAQVWLYHP